jgi:hypothetical protein
MPPGLKHGFCCCADADLDNDTFESALKQFEQNNNKQAISFMAYNASFPKFMLKLISIYLAQPIL